jgi:hypothetical protein
MRREITPLTEIGRRIPIAGKLRMGVKTAKAMKAIDTWRLTSPDRNLIDQIAAHYGGTAKPWNEPKANPSEQFEVITESSELRVLLVPDGLSTHYELWSGGGCKRRCDGITCTEPQMVGGDDYDMVDVECICRANNVAECEPHTRLTVVLPEFSFTGAWLYESKSWNAAQELPGFHELIHTMQESGRMVDAVLSIESRERMTPTGKRKFKVPKLSVKNTPLQIAAGAASLAVGAGAPGSGLTVPSLGSGVPVHVGSYSDGPPRTDSEDLEYDGITEAEIVSDEELEVIELLKADARNFGLSEDAYVAAIRAGSTDEVTGQLSLERFRQYSQKVRDGEIKPLGLKANGRVQWETR